jgi:hypothetical protein
MANAVVNDYFSFMSDKSGGKSVPREPRVVVVPPAIAAAARPDASDRRQESQMEVTESDLSDTVIERIFRRPSDPADRSAPQKYKNTP